MTYIIYSYDMLNPNLKFITHEDWHRESMKSPKFRKAWDALEVEFQIINDILKKRIEKDMTQRQLAKKIGSGQATISRLEAGNYNPSIKFLKRVAEALGAKLKVSFV